MRHELRNIELTTEWQQFVQAMEKSHNAHLKKVAKILQNFQYDTSSSGLNDKYINHIDNQPEDIVGVILEDKNNKRKIALLSNEGVKYFVVVNGKKGCYQDKSDIVEFSYNKNIVIKPSKEK